jgi:hypothetical protein
LIFLYAPASAPVCNWLQKPQNFPLFFFFAGGRIFEKNERKILRILNFAKAEAEADIFDYFVFLAASVPPNPTLAAIKEFPFSLGIA